MKEKTGLLCAVLLALLVRSSHQYSYKSGGLSGSSAQSFSSSSASSFASASSFSSSSSFDGKTGDFINEIGSPIGHTGAGGLSASNAANAGASAFASAGAQVGTDAFGIAGANSKASAGSSSISGAIGHGLGVGGGVGLDNEGSIDGTGKYGSTFIKGNCGGGSCSDFNGGFGSGTSFTGTVGANSKTSAGSAGFNGASGHGLGVGGGIGLGNDGSIEGALKYGSSGIKGNCRGGSCFDFNGDFETGTDFTGSAGTNSKTSAGSSSINGASGHGLGVGGGVGLDNEGSIEGTGKYGSAAIKGNCGGGLCSNNNGAFGFGGLGTYSDSGTGTGIYSSTGSADSSSNAGSSGSTGSYSGGNADSKGNCAGGFCSGSNGDFGTSPPNSYNTIGTSGGQTGGNGYFGGSSNYPGDKPNYNTQISGNYPSAGTGLSGCDGSSGSGCSGVEVEYPSNVKPLPGAIITTGNIPIFKPVGSDGASLCGSVGTTCGGSPSVGSSYPGFATGSVQITKPDGSISTGSSKPVITEVTSGDFGSFAGTGSTGPYGSQTPKPLIPSGGSHSGLPLPSFNLETPIVDKRPHTAGSPYDGTFPGPSLSIYHSIPASSVPSRPGTVTTGITGTTAGADAHSASGTYTGSGSIGPGTNTIIEGHYTGPFPGPSGSIHQSKPASGSKPSYAGTGSTASAGATAGAATTSGTQYTGTFPGSSGNIHQTKPAIDGGKPSYVGAGSTASAGATGGATTPSGTQFTWSFPGPSGSIHQSKPATGGVKPSSAGAGSTAFAGSNTQSTAGATTGSGVHYTGPFPGPSGSIYESKPPTSGKPIYSGTGSTIGAGSTASAGATADANAQSGAGSTTTNGQHYTGPFPGPSGNIHQSTTVSISGATSGTHSGPNLQGSTITTPYTEKPIINIIPITHKPDIDKGQHYSGTFPGPSGSIHTSKPASSVKSSAAAESGANTDGNGATCSYGNCSPKPQIPQPGSAGGCGGISCDVLLPTSPNTATVESGTATDTYTGKLPNPGFGSFPSIGCVGSNCDSSSKVPSVSPGNTDVTYGNYAPGVTCLGLSCTPDSTGNAVANTAASADANAGASGTLIGQYPSKESPGTYQISLTPVGTGKDTENAGSISGAFAGSTANAGSIVNAGSGASSGSYSSGFGTPSGSTPSKNGCGSLVCSGGLFGLGAVSGSSANAGSGSFGGSFSSAKSGSSSFSSANSGASSHSFSSSSSSAGSFGFPSGGYTGTKSGAFSNSYSSAGSSGSSSHY